MSQPPMRVFITYTLSRWSTTPGFDADEYHVEASGDVAVDELGYYALNEVTWTTTPDTALVDREGDDLMERLVDEYRRMQRAP